MWAADSDWGFGKTIYIISKESGWAWMLQTSGIHYLLFLLPTLVEISVDYKSWTRDATLSWTSHWQHCLGHLRRDMDKCIPWWPGTGVVLTGPFSQSLLMSRKFGPLRMIGVMGVEQVSRSIFLEIFLELSKSFQSITYWIYIRHSFYKPWIWPGPDFSVFGYSWSQELPPDIITEVTLGPWVR